MRRSPLRRRTPLSPGPPPTRRPFTPASAAQRAKVAGQRCLVCLKPGVDAAHVVSRALGGCDDADCVVALCRSHHRAFDRGELDLLPYLEPRCRTELAHAVGHLGLIGTLRRVSARRDVLPEAAPRLREASAPARSFAPMPATPKPALIEPLLTAIEIAQLLGVPRASVYEYARRGEDPLPSVRVGRHLRFVREDVHTWLTRQRSG